MFGKLAFFTDYPWFLSCSAAGLLAFIAFALSSWGLKEVALSLSLLLLLMNSSFLDSTKQN